MIISIINVMLQVPISSTTILEILCSPVYPILEVIVHVRIADTLIRMKRKNFLETNTNVGGQNHTTLISQVKEGNIRIWRARVRSTM